jgi:hypothetical protein
MSFKKNRQSILILCVLAIVLLFPFRNVSSQEGCGECPNPLVGVQELKIKGNIESIIDINNGIADVQFPGRLPERFMDFEALLGKGPFCAYYLLWSDLFARADELSLFRQRNPCAKIFLAYRKTYRAKFIVTSTATIELGNGSAKVEHCLDQNIEQKLVPRIGTIEIKNELIALKNGDIYDTGVNKIDWLYPLPPHSGFYRGINQDAFEGVLNTDTLHRQPIIFEKGDIGVTIRNKETPSSCSMDVDETSFFPQDYWIKIQNVRNLFGEQMPNNVRIALKVDKGKIKNGEELDGWKVFTTIGGEIPIEVFYEVPECSKAKSDSLEIAAVCDWHDGEPSVGETRITKHIHIPQCLVRSAVLTDKRHSAFHKETEFNPGGGVLAKNEEQHENHYEVTVTMTFEDKPFMILPEGDNLLIYGYRLKSYEVASQNIYYKEKSYDLEKGPYFFREVSCDDYMRGTVTKIEPIVESFTRKALELTVDKRTNEVVRVDAFPSFNAWVVKRGQDIRRYRDSHGGNEDIVDEVGGEGWHSVGPNLDEPFTDDGKHLIRGYKEKVETGEFSKTTRTIEWKIFRY